MFLVAPVTAITVDAERRVIADAGLVVSGTRIEPVGKATDRADHYPRAPRLDRPRVEGDDYVRRSTPPPPTPPAPLGPRPRPEHPA